MVFTTLRALTAIFLLVAAASFKSGNTADVWVKNASAASEHSSLSVNEKQMIMYMNLVRTDPVRFISDYVIPYKAKLRKTDVLKYYADSAYFTNLISELRVTKPMGLLRANPSLTRMARDHAGYSGKAGVTGHTGRNGMNLDRRINQFYPMFTLAAENCTYGYGDPLSAFMSLLVDAGVADLGHRKNILNPSFTQAGVGWASHKVYKVNCVIEFAAVH